MAEQKRELHGIFVIDKPQGLTSHDVVARVRRLARQKRVGHAGTLDPAATGVLPLCLGQATRVAEYLSERGKAYRATIRFGVVTDTYDAEGRMLREAPVTLSAAQIEAIIPTFVGEQSQVPPRYSAIQRDGQRAYTLARAGQEIEMEPRPIVIHALRMVAWDSPDLTLEIECGKGTYIRSLAYDLGERLGPGAHLAALIRTRSGPFTLRQSLTLDALADALTNERWREHLYGADEALLDHRAAILAAESETRLRNGQPLRFEQTPPTRDAPTADDLLRLYSTDGRFLGIARWDAASGAWAPHKVLAIPPVDDTPDTSDTPDTAPTT